MSARKISFFQLNLKMIKKKKKKKKKFSRQKKTPPYLDLH